MNKRPVAEVLAELIAKHDNISANELQRQTGVPQPTITRILGGESLDPATSSLKPLADFFGVTLAELRGERALGTEEPRPTYETSKVPVISWVTAGNFCDTEDPYPLGSAEEWLLCPVPHSSRTYALRVRGISMEPDFKNDDYIFIDPSIEPKNRSFVIVRLDDNPENQTTFKQLIIEDGRRFLKPLNPDWPDQMIEINGQATICGVVIFKGRKL